jgi:hypothetical protein
MVRSTVEQRHGFSHFFAFSSSTPSVRWKQSANHSPEVPLLQRSAIELGSNPRLPRESASSALSQLMFDHGVMFDQRVMFD